MKADKQNININVAFIVYYTVILFYAVLLAPILLKELNIFHTFMYRHMFVASVFIGFGLLLGTKSLIPYLVISHPLTYCSKRVFKGIYLLITYCLVSFLFIFLELAQQYDGIHIILTAMSSYVGYHTMNSFSFVKPTRYSPLIIH